MRSGPCCPMAWIFRWPSRPMNAAAMTTRVMDPIRRLLARMLIPKIRQVKGRAERHPDSNDCTAKARPAKGRCRRPGAGSGVAPLRETSLWSYICSDAWRKAAVRRPGGCDMRPAPVSRRVFLELSKAAAAGAVFSPGIIGRAQAATTKLKLSSSLPNDAKYANGRVYYDNLQKNLKANGLGEQVEITFFPDNQLGQEIDVINSVKLGVIDLMVSGSSISANLVPLVGTFDLGYLFSSFPQQTKAFDAGAARPIEEALLKGANIRIISWAYNFGSR